jgi:malonyl-CoA O-methyltransferase
MLAALRPWANISLLELPGCAPGCGEAALPGLDQLLESIARCCPDGAVLVGWSLGGQLAIELAVRNPKLVAALVTLGSNPCFVATGDWPGMNSRDFCAFRAGYLEDPIAGLRRFDLLQSGGAANRRGLLRELQGQRRALPGEELQAGLAWLAQLDQRDRLRQLAIPQLHLLAERDALVPGAALAAQLEELLSGNSLAEVQLLEGASHVSPLDVPAAVTARIGEFLDARGMLARPGKPLTMPAKQDIAASFSRAAPQYDSVAALQRAVGTRLMERLEPGADSPAHILDLGCGTGSFQPDLLQRYPQARYIGLDLAPGMIAYARERFGADKLWLVGDAEALPLAAGSVDLVFSSLAFQWCYQPQKLFAELARILSPGGRCLFTSLGPDTLHELRTAWAAVDAHQHVNRFLPLAELEKAACRVPGMHLSLDREFHRMEYNRVGELLAELKTLGAHNMNRDRPAGLTSRRVMQGMLEAYEAQRDSGVLPATYEVIFGEVRRI